ncbi:MULTISPECIES: flagellar basal body-associated protein FliL [Bacillaceae]|uniref:flagellar basal body-associated protein FliL n=1 Tax=Bacillaceae TaxID=186817 RepID=UPI0006AF5F62|nr:MULTISPECIES: flagellar basal body-associated protein FliL [Bacillaceae]ALC86023.1 flagellar basal body-associated protein FliL [Bacillus sp. FJAT-22090]KQL35521.1 flagellar basal body-associated protein FliL [Psychrobacillus sp. FJAT-21963]MDF2066021.1 flagellar basal body-associated protein FliL [Bacillus sp. Cr_A10]
MKSKNKLLTIMLIILVCITLLGVVALLFISQLNKPDEETGPTIDEIVESSIDIPEITTNLAGNKFIRISLKVQTDSKEAAEELIKRDFQVKNIVITELSEMTPEDLEGKQGKATFQSSLKTKINELMNDGEVQQVYITSYIIQ